MAQYRRCRQQRQRRLLCRWNCYRAQSYDPGYIFNTIPVIGALGQLAGTTFGNSFYGAIEDISIYNRSLATTEIQQVYHLGGAGQSGATLQGNRIGTNSAGTAALANGGNGITVSNSAGNTI